MTHAELWATCEHDLHEALDLVKSGFGDHFDCDEGDWHNQSQHPIRLIHVYPGPTGSIERKVKAELDKIGWQLTIVSLVDRNRFKSMRDIAPQATILRNKYGITPISLITPRPDFVYHATETVKLTSMRKEGLKPKDEEGDYPDTEGKIHVCLQLDAGKEGATHWAYLLSKRKGLCCKDYSILKVDLRGVATARAYKDLHSVSGIVVDRIAYIPFSAVVERYVFSDNRWIVGDTKGSGVESI